MLHINVHNPLYAPPHAWLCIKVFSEVFFGGDQLTAERVRGVQRCLRNELTPEDQLRGLAPVAADWHTKQSFICNTYNYIQSQQWSCVQAHSPCALHKRGVVENAHRCR